MRNRPEFVEVWAACRRAGLHLTPVNWHLTLDEMSYIVDDSEARALVVDTGVAPAVDAGATSLPAGSRPCSPSADALDVGEPYDDALAAEPAGPIDDPTPGTLMLYTSGTTGRAEGGPRSVRTRPRSTTSPATTTPACTCAPGPLYHAAPLNISLISPLSNGATVVLMDGWSPEVTLRLVADHRVTHTHMVPTMFHRLLALDESTRAEHDLSSLRLVVHGAAPCPVGVKQRMIEWLGPVIVEYYAATEGAGTLVDSGTWLRKPGTVGRPYPADQVIVGDDDARPLAGGRDRDASGSRARRATSSSTSTTPRRPAASQRGAWYTLGDVGYIDDDGFLFLVGTQRGAHHLRRREHLPGRGRRRPARAPRGA